MADVITQTIKIEASLTKIQSDLKTLEGNFASSFGRISSVANSALGTLGVGLSIGGLIAFGKKVIDTGDLLSDLADQTGNTVELLGGIKPVLESNNTSLDSFAKGIGKVQRALGDIHGSGKEAAEAFKALGLDVRELQRLTPDQFLEKFVAALAKVENRNDRAAIAFRILGKAAAETIPALLQLAESGIPKLDEATANAYRTLGQFADGLAVAGAGLVNFAALLIEPYARLVLFTTALAGLRALTNDEKFGKFAKDIETFTGAVSRSTGLAVGKIEGMSNDALNEMAKTSDAATKVAIDNLVKTRQAFDKVKPPSPAGEPPSKDLLAGAKTKDTSVQQFVAGLGKEVDALIQKFELLRKGEEAAFEVGLRDQVAKFNLGRQLEGKSQVSPAETERIIQSLIKDFVGINEEIKLWERNQEAVNAIVKATDQDLGEMGKTGEEAARHIAEQLEKIEPLFRDLQKTLAIEILPEDQQANARIIQDVGERIKIIEAWRIAEIAATGEVERVNEEAAQATADAWAAAGEKMKKTVDEQTEFIRRAFERGFDAVSDTIGSVLDDGIKSTADFGEKIRKMMNSLVADFLTTQLKISVLGKDFGKEGAPIGGWLGSLIEKLFGSAPAAGGATGYEAGFFHGGGEIQPGRNLRSLARATIMHAGGAVPILGESGEYMLKRWSAARIGKPNLDYMNESGKLPPSAMGASNSRKSSQPQVVHIHMDHPNFTNRESVSQIQQQLRRAVRRGGRND